MTLENRINAFSELGKIFLLAGNNELSDFSNPFIKNYYNLFEEIIKKSTLNNPWFTEENIRYSLLSNGKLLNKENLLQWTKKYKIEQKTAKKIGVVLAGNIPLVGFHDFLSVLISGNIFIGKLSSKDDLLLPFIKKILIEIDKEFESLINFCENKLEDIDAVIATGSNNSARYFHQYFSKYPNIIRKNRNGIGIITANESQDELKQLGKDIFQYFGLGCRNISKIFIPENYNLNHFFKAIEEYNYLYNHNKYANNVDYYRSIYLMNRIKHYDNGFLLLKEDDKFSSPIGVIYFSYYRNLQEVNDFIDLNQELIQCIVSKDNTILKSVPFGKSQEPELWDYADGIDTMLFLTHL